jgi:hypothetical protein
MKYLHRSETAAFVGICSMIVLACSSVISNSFGKSLAAIAWNCIVIVITTEKIKTLREQSGAGIMDCRSALVGCDGDIDIILQLFYIHP